MGKKKQVKSEPDDQSKPESKDDAEYWEQHYSPFSRSRPGPIVARTMGNFLPY